jgi:hypothetical protein
MLRTMPGLCCWDLGCGTMQNATNEAATRHSFVPLDSESRRTVDTATAAFHLNRRPQTLRIWACNENGPIRPLRINGRLAWPTAELRRVLQVAA